VLKWRKICLEARLLFGDNGLAPSALPRPNRPEVNRTVGKPDEVKLDEIKTDRLKPTDLKPILVFWYHNTTIDRKRRPIHPS